MFIELRVNHGFAKPVHNAVESAKCRTEPLLTGAGSQKKKASHGGATKYPRIEGFSDAVFAFAVTLIVVSLEVPRTFDELLKLMRGFVPFAVCFLMLMRIWYSQYLWFRRYGLQSTISLALNATLLFLVLSFVYPLKSLNTFLFQEFVLHDTHVRLANSGMVHMVTEAQSRLMLLIYDVGFLSVFGLFLLLYGYAWRSRKALHLTVTEEHLTLSKMGGFTCSMIVGLLSITVLETSDNVLIAGCVLLLLAPVRMVYYLFMSAWMRRRLVAAVGSSITLL